MYSVHLSRSRPISCSILSWSSVSRKEREIERENGSFLNRYFVRVGDHLAEVKPFPVLDLFKRNRMDPMRERSLMMCTLHRIFVPDYCPILQIYRERDLSIGSEKEKVKEAKQFYSLWTYNPSFDSLWTFNIRKDWLAVKPTRKVKKTQFSSI